MSFASGDAHSVVAMSSEASLDAEASTPIGELSERSHLETSRKMPFALLLTTEWIQRITQSIPQKIEG